MSMDFGSCCENLRDAMDQPPESVFRMGENGVFYMAIGYADTDEGIGWFEQAVLFCPFCGSRLQDREEMWMDIFRKAAAEALFFDTEEEDWRILAPRRRRASKPEEDGSCFKDDYCFSVDDYYGAAIALTEP